jgi:hypothetical protein
MRFANRTENQVMTVYMPILKGRASEIQALEAVTIFEKRIKDHLPRQ